MSVSKFTKKKLIKLNIPSTKIDVVPNGIDLTKYESIKVKKSRNPTLCFVGRLISHKRVKDLITAIFILKKTFPKIKCKIIGNGPEKDNLCNFNHVNFTFSTNRIFPAFCTWETDFQFLFDASCNNCPYFRSDDGHWLCVVGESTQF